MQWFFEDDNTSPVFTAKQHAESKHVTTGVRPLPRRGVAFCLGRGLPVLLERFRARLIMAGARPRPGAVWRRSTPWGWRSCL